MSSEEISALEQAILSPPPVVDTVLGDWLDGNGYPDPPTGNRTSGDLALNTATDLDSTVVIALGCVRVGDGGGGIFVWSSGTDDGGTIIVPNSNLTGTGGCWKRVCFGSIDVRWFGAPGDSTDQTQAFLNALAVGGRILVPAGTYRISRPLLIEKNTTLIGDGNTNTNVGTGGTILRKTSAVAGPLLMINNDGAGSSVQSLTITGENGAADDGILIAGNNVALRDVSVFGMGQDGIRIGVTTENGEAANTWLLDRVVSSANARHGVYISDNTTSEPDANGGTSINLMVQFNGGDGLRLGKAYLNTFVGTLTELNTGYGFYLEAEAKWNAFVGGDSEGNTAGMSYVHVNSRQNRFSIPQFDEWTAIPAGDTTPTVAAHTHWVCFQASATTITNFIGAKDAEIVIRLDNMTTIQHNNTYIRAKGGVDVTGNSNSLVSFRNINGIWYETWRNF